MVWMSSRCFRWLLPAFLAVASAAVPVAAAAQDCAAGGDFLNLPYHRGNQADRSPTPRTPAPRSSRRHRA